jgi:hypothetical protein
MIRVAVFLAAIAQMPLAAAADSVSDSNCRALDPTPAAPIGVGQLANQTGQCAPALGPMGLGSMEEAVRSAPTNVAWNNLDQSRSMWATFEYLGVWVKSSHVPSPPISSPIRTPQSQGGMPTQHVDTILSGDERLDAEMHSGGRIAAGAWIIPNAISVEASFFAVQPETTHFSTAVGTGAR